ncbi:hypothetical protein IGI04_034042 [Brassica rapa subsp. trilocularis]|uniref:C3H1-type domain-containing protein n=1 Tax=Brassica rapa subsp. trilocularis TaxID=1813537 RepID=A0ABQ7L8I8_BRACM|nr:hypothetical protein IGI04_034042 [Brassica rapa subsp. trilocularis]
MPPKQQPKADLAKKQKQVEDKTFGLKNKNKSKNVQKYVQSLKQSVQPKPDASKVAAKVWIQSPSCRKGEKIDIYSDKRDEDGNMEEWDQETLEKVVESKKNEYNQNKPTDIVCKYFLDAVEKKQYGWFWACPNGGKECHYRHALPPGYILKSQMKALLEEESQKMPVEEVIENERAKLKTATQMTPALFMEWKRKKIAERDAGLAASQAERAKNDRMSGRELFLSNASLFVDDAEAFEEYQREKEEEEIEQKAKDKEAEAPGTSKSSGDAEQSSKKVDEEDEDDDDDDLDMDELDELEASLSKTSIQIREPND